MESDQALPAGCAGDAMSGPTRSHSVAERIAQDIQAGALPPGAWLKQIDLERRYGCSRGDVRRALDELVAKRLVQHVPNRGHHVFELDPQRLAQLGQLRAILEAAAADLSYDKADAAALQRLEALAARFEAAVRDGTLLEQHAANIAFHMALLELCPNPELAAMIRETRNRVPSALLSQWPTRGWIEQSIRDHADMIAALRACDRDALRRVVVGHMREGRRPGAG
ncbi:GntR family transcriptional regulator [Limobrevibacterium gyesilva]|uniref:GntR family transcriptional regulator n=1 Tax=Limobrevibacterium gyesilva TaxID=2991712 RepID=A0AA41YNC6_9PROT|nr:GntR family transcriptional regulator [Limobrevibacterium gyesilva]MCW3475243.1 GntR family transcriptional regulator [Limobrevibacterium gyesilva]